MEAVGGANALVLVQPAAWAEGLPRGRQCALSCHVTIVGLAPALFHLP